MIKTSKQLPDPKVAAKDPKSAIRSKRYRDKKRAEKELVNFHDFHGEGPALIEAWRLKFALTRLGDEEAQRFVNCVFPLEATLVQQEVLRVLEPEPDQALREKLERVVEYMRLPDRLRPRFPPLFLTSGGCLSLRKGLRVLGPRLAEY